MPMAGGAEPARSARRSSPRSLIFPYLRGLVFCADADQRRRLEGARRRPTATRRSRPSRSSTPRSTGPSPTCRPPSTSASSTPASGWKELGRNVVGEMQLGVLLRRHGGKAAAAGWDGDRYAVFEGPDGRLGLVWLSTWDSEDDAREFARGYARFQTVKLGSEAAQPEEVPDSFLRLHEDKAKDSVFVVERRGKDVAVVEGFPAQATDHLLATAFLVKKTEMAHKPATDPKPAAEEPKATEVP